MDAAGEEEIVSLVRISFDEILGYDRTCFPAAAELIRRYDMQEVFGRARMYLGPFPDMSHERVFGVTTFELG